MPFFGIGRKKVEVLSDERADEIVDAMVGGDDEDGLPRVVAGPAMPVRVVESDAINGDDDAALRSTRNVDNADWDKWEETIHHEERKSRRKVFTSDVSWAVEEDSSTNSTSTSSTGTSMGTGFPVVPVAPLVVTSSGSPTTETSSSDGSSAIISSSSSDSSSSED